jgi:geranylgeranyl reductase family protein
MPTHHRVLVVGAGPAGSSVAFHLLEQGVEDVLVLDKSTFPRDKLCGGGLTRKAQRQLERMGVLEQVAAQAYEVPKVYLVTPTGNVFHERIVPGKRPQMLVLNRRFLDDILMRRARECGATVREGVEVTHLVHEGSRCRGVRTRDGGLLSADVVVIAAGSHSARFVQEGVRALHMVCFEARYRGRPIDEGTACLAFDEEFVPQYGWVFPETENLVNVGVGAARGKGSGKQLRDRLEVMVSKYLPHRLEGARAAGPPRGFSIRATYRVRRVVDSNVLYVGEAGNLVDPLTFEGISQAMVSGRHAARAIAKYLGGGDRRCLLGYEGAVREEFDHFSSMRWVGAMMKRPTGCRLLEAVLGRKVKWQRAGKLFGELG